MPSSKPVLRYRAKLTYKAKKGQWPAMKGEIIENGVIIGKFERKGVVDGYVPPITYKFLSEQARNRFDDFADYLTIEETIEAIIV